MPRVVDYAPAWLSRPSPGAAVFASSDLTKKPSDTESYLGPTKLIARRGTDVFTVVDNQIRWADLSILKDRWQESVRQKRRETGYGAEESRSASSGTVRTSRNGIPNEFDPAKTSEDDIKSSQELHYRVLTTPIYGQIRQLVPSPNGAFLAILTTHTIHIAILPDPSHLSGPDNSPLRIRTHQLGPATHVIPESPVVSAVWHPLGTYDSHGGCIVTVTADSVVRVWEIARKDNWSFDRPALAIDLKKLIDGTSSDEDFSPSGFGQNKGFSADLFDMEAASATFGGQGSDDEDAWGGMTLWVAMRQGDVYALCPLLPSKWQAPSLAISCLTTSVVHKLAAMQEGVSEENDERKALEQQYTWLQEIDNQEPVQIADETGFLEVRNRPAMPSAIPRLQGPFQFGIEEEPDDLDITDIYVIPAKSDTDDFLSGEDFAEYVDENKEEGLSGTVICLVTENGVVHIGLELDGVEGQWLPSKNQGNFTAPMSEASELLLLESLATVKETNRLPNSWPTFTRDAISRYNFFVTTANTVTFFSLASWARQLEPELKSEDLTGSSFRMKVICDGSIAEREPLVQLPVAKLENGPEYLTSSLVIYDYDLGYMLLTFAPSQLCALALESAAGADLEPTRDFIAMVESGPNTPPLHTLFSQRVPYQVPSILYSENPMASFVADHVPHGRRQGLKEPIRLSPSTLDTMATAHRVSSAYTHAVEKAASDLFSRCDRLQKEMGDQLRQLIAIAERINDVAQGTVRRPQKSEKTGREAALDSRMAAVESKQKHLITRYNALRSRLLKAGGRPISDKERDWIQEVDALSSSLGVDGESKTDLIQRLQTAKSLAESLVAQVNQSSSNSQAIRPTVVDGRSSPLKVSPQVQNATVEDAMDMVEREGAVIDAITSRLERLSTAAFEP